MALQVGKDQVGLAKQTGKGAIAANPAFVHGLAGGGISLEISQEADPLTSAYLAPAGTFRDQAAAGASIDTRAFAKAIGIYLLAALGNVVTSGTGPYTHTFTLGSSLPYLTVFEKKGDGAIVAVRDCKLDELELAWEGNKPVTVSAKFAGTVLSFPATFTGTVDESDSALYFTPVGGTFSYDVDSGTPVESPVKSGKITIKRSAEPQYNSGAIEAGDVAEGMCDVEIGLTVNPDDTTLWRTIATGAAAGTGVQDEPLYGSAEIAFALGSDSLTFTADRVAFLADLPEADPAGGAAEMELSGIAFRTTDTPLTVALVNDQATY